MPELPSTFPAIDDAALSADEPGGAALEAWEALQVEKLYNLPEKIGVIERTTTTDPPRLSSYEWASAFTVPVVLPPGCDYIEARGVCRVGGSASDVDAAQLRLAVYLPYVSQQGRLNVSAPGVVTSDNPITLDSQGGGETTFQQGSDDPGYALGVDVSQIDTSRARQAIVCVMLRTDPLSGELADPTAISSTTDLGALSGQRIEIGSASSDPDRHTAILSQDIPDENELLDILRPYPSTSAIDLAYLAWPDAKSDFAGTTVALVNLHWVEFEALTLRMVPRDTQAIDANGGGYQAGKQMRFDRASGDNVRESRTVFRRYRHHNTHWDLGAPPNEGWGQANRLIYVDDDEADVEIQSTFKKQHKFTKLWVDMLCLGVVLPDPNTDSPRRDPVRTPAFGEEIGDLGTTESNIEVTWQVFDQPNTNTVASGTVEEEITFWPITYQTIVPILQQMGVQYLTDSVDDLAQSFREGLLYLERGQVSDLLVLSRFRFEVDAETNISRSLYELNLNIGHPASNFIPNSRIAVFPPTVHETLPLDE